MELDVDELAALEQELQLAIELPKQDPYYDDDNFYYEDQPSGNVASKEELFKSLFDLSTVRKPKAKFGAVSGKVTKLRGEVISHKRTVLDGKKTIVKVDKYVTYVDEEEQAMFPATRLSLPSNPPASIRLNIFKTCRSSDNIAGARPSMPSLRMEVNEKGYDEIPRDREKNWVQDELGPDILSRTHDPELQTYKMSFKELGLGKYSNVSKIPTLYWSSAFQQLMRRKRLFRQSRLISESRCIVDVYGLGINGRIFAEGSTSGRLLIIECYSTWSSQKHVIVLTCNQLRSLFAGQTDLLRPGHKEDIVNCIVDYLYFAYTVRMPPLPLDEAQEDKIQIVEHLERPDILPKGFPGSIADLIRYLTVPNVASDVKPGDTPWPRPVLTETLKIGTFKRNSGVEVRRLEQEAIRKQLELEELAKKNAWLAIIKRYRGLEGVRGFRCASRLIVLTAHRVPSRPTVVKITGHVLGDCLQLTQSIRLSELQDAYQISIPYLKWPPEYIRATIRRVLNEIIVVASDVVSGRELSLSWRGIVGTMETARRLIGCYDTESVNRRRKEWYDTVINAENQLNDNTEAPPEEKVKQKKRKKEQVVIKQLSENERLSNITRGIIAPPTWRRRADYISVVYSDLAWHCDDVKMTAENPLSRPFRFQLDSAMGLNSRRIVSTRLPQSKPRREIGRGRRLCSKAVKMDNVYIIYSFYLASKLEEGDIPKWYEPPPPPVKAPKQLKAKGVEGEDQDIDEDNDDQSTASSATSGSLLKGVTGANDAKNELFSQFATALKVEMEIYIPFESKVLDCVTIPAQTKFRVLFTKEDIFHILDDEELAHKVCQINYSTCFLTWTSAEITELERQWDLAAQKIVQKCLWLPTAILFKDIPGGLRVIGDGSAGANEIDKEIDIESTHQTISKPSTTNSDNKAPPISPSTFHMANRRLRKEGSVVLDHLSVLSPSLGLFVVPSWSQVIFSRTLKIPSDLDLDKTKLLQVTLWQSGSELGVVAYDINPASYNIYFAQSDPQSQSEQLNIIRFMPLSERVVYIAMYLTLEMRFDEIREEGETGETSIRFGFLDSLPPLPGEELPPEMPEEEEIVVEAPPEEVDLPAEDVGKLLMASMGGSAEDDEAMLRMMEENNDDDDQ